MTVKLSSLKVDLSREREGEWIDADIRSDPDFAGTAFNVRSTNYPAYVAARTAEQLRLIAKSGDADPTPDEEAEINGRLAAEHLLLDWRGFDEAYSADTAMTVLTDEGYRRVRHQVFVAATKVGRREVEHLKVAEKN